MGCEEKSREFLFLNINILILHYASMQSEIDEIDLLKICIARLEVKNAKLRKKFAEIEAKNAEFKARIAKLEDKQIQNELIKNLLSISCDKNC
jgi:cell division protein FtsB